MSTSVKVSRQTWSPALLSPQWATESASIQPGAPTSRCSTCTGIPERKSVPGRVPHRARLPSAARRGLRSRSMLAGLMAKSRPRNPASSPAVADLVTGQPQRERHRQPLAAGLLGGRPSV
ncbi:MAG TPA: hypothetical protein PLU30_01310 [Verrucomicrobiae bacterium]|nr:hypothetical protein [Verrucomicrobiae bacterium]